MLRPVFAVVPKGVETQVQPAVDKSRFGTMFDDDDDVAAIEAVRWSRWRRSSRRAWQSFEGGVARLSRHDWRFAAVGFVVAWGAYGAYLGGQFRPGIDGLAAAIGFPLGEVEIRGLEQASALEITGKIGAADHRSLLTVSAGQVRDDIAALPWVEDVSVNKVYPDKLVVAVKERVAYALWQDDGKVYVVDQGGAVMTDQIEERHLKLPLVVGQGANIRASEARGLIDASPVIGPRIHAAVLVAERRWNLVTHDGVEIRLPEDGAAAALAEIAQLQGQTRLLDRDIESIDLRAPDRMYVRLTDAAAQARKDAMKAKTAKKKGADT